ncbi:MAG: hypothetical protein ABI451_11340, partial [Dokdonella sp.]
MKHIEPRWLLLLLLIASMAWASDESASVTLSAPVAPFTQNTADAESKSSGCVSCHSESDQKTMHRSPAVVLGCSDCHGGDATVFAPAGTVAARDPRTPAVLRAYPEPYRAAMDHAHVLPANAEHWPSSANPERSYTWLQKESADFIRFINPGDLRVARAACGACHLGIVEANEKSLMANAAMFWGAAAYNNGILPNKHSILGEAYTDTRVAARTVNAMPNDENMDRHGVLPSIDPLPAWEITPPADIFRVFERGGRNIVSQFPEIGLPNSTGLLQRLEEPGKPDIRQSNRGPGTGSRVAIPVLNIAKTRLNDPLLWFLGTNDNPGDYRSSGCTACHV